eukprot:TRINITY_DN4885_c1_g1_i1.p1 TRINITY_DN4885_c1_g1~~TRINITY_DN4885_c1_g1_i1.p1  ORF type:complete len:895 (+),score=398.19 TRINITY_DN4885_c1_g1_i1:46-2730(+)
MRAAFLTALVASAAARYEEEVGRYDFHKQLFGGMHAAAYSATGKRVFFAGKGGIVGAVKPKGGDVAWRRRMSNQDAPVAALNHADVDTAVVAVSKNGAVNMFAEDGALLWEAVVPGFSGKGDGSAEAAAVVGISGEPGEWTAVVAATEKELSVHRIAAQSATRIGWQAGETHTLPEGADAASLRVGDGYVFAAVPAKQEVAVLRLDVIAEAAWKTVDTTKAKGFTLATAQGSLVALRNAATEECMDLSADGTLSEARPAGHACVPDGPAVPAAIDGFPSETEHGGVVAAWPASFGGDKPAAKVVFKFASGATALVSKTGDAAWKTRWVRDDGLGDVTDVVSAGNPKHSEEEEAEPSAVEEYVQMLQAQVQGATNFALRLPKLADQLVQTMAGNGEPEDYTGMGDQFGLQVSFVLNSANTLYCISTVDGSVKWQVFAGAMVKGTGADVAIKKVLVSTSEQYDVPHLFVWLRETTASGAAVDHVAQLQIMKQGQVKEVRTLKGAVQKAAVVPHVKYVDQAGHEYTTVVFVLADQTLVAHPPAAAAAMEADKFNYFMMNEEAGRIVGYTGATQTWSVQLTATPGENVVATSLAAYQPKLFVTVDNLKVANRTTDEHGRRSTKPNEVMSKYINPNAVLVVTQVPAGPQRDAYLVLYLVDGVTGAVLMSMVQPNAVGPVKVVALEHMYAVHFLNTKRKRYQMSVLEMFENTDRIKGVYGDSVTNVKQVVTAFTGLNERNTYSSFEIAPPITIPTAFTFPVAATAIGATESQLGVGSKYLLAALSTDEIVSFDLNKHMEASQKMGVSIMAYHPTMTISYNLTVVGVDAIKTFASKLESTCLMVGYGNDLFISRVASGKPFDMLNEDFAYPVLVLTVLFVTVLTVTLASLASAGQLKQQWT